MLGVNWGQLWDAAVSVSLCFLGNEHWTLPANLQNTQPQQVPLFNTVLLEAALTASSCDSSFLLLTQDLSCDLLLVWIQLPWAFLPHCSIDLRVALYTLRTESICISKYRCWCFIWDPCQNMEGPISTRRPQYRNIFIQLDPHIPIVVLPGTDWCFQVLTRVPYLWQAEEPKKVHESNFVLRVYLVKEFNHFQC